MTTAYQETRIQTIRRIASSAMNAGELNVVRFSEAFVALAFELARSYASETNLRVPHTTDGEQYEKDRYHNQQIVRRWITGAVAKFPHELEEAWVKALPQPYRDQALRELAARYDLLAAPSIDSMMALANMGEAMQKIGSFVKSMTPIVEDNRIDENDLPYVKPAMTDIAELMALLAGFQQQLARVLPDEVDRRVQLKAV